MVQVRPCGRPEKACDARLVMSEGGSPEAENDNPRLC
jgi:hypothetical protein